MTPEQNLPQKCLHQDTQVVWGLGAPSVCGHHTQYQAKHPSSIPWQTWISQMFGKAGDVLQPQRESPLLVKSRWSSSHQGCMKHGGSGPYSQEAFAEFSDTNRDFLKGHGGVIWGTPCLTEGRAAPRDCKSFISWRSLKTGPPGRPQHQSWLGVLSDTRAFSASFLLSPGQSCVLHLTLYHLHLVLTPDCITANVAITWLSVRMEQNYVSYNWMRF